MRDARGTLREVRDARCHRFRSGGQASRVLIAEDVFRDGDS